MTSHPPEDDLAIPEEPLPISVLTGFLGSGKTTLLSALLSHPDMEETAVIVNEFGEIGLDHLLVEKVSEDTVLLNSGCLCCTVRNDLVQGLRDLYRRRVKREVPPFRRLVVETTGLADPAPILQTLMSDPFLSGGRFRLDGVITTVDGVNGLATLDSQIESVKQAAVADRLLITKTDLPEAVGHEALTARLRRLNPSAPVLKVSHGETTPDQLFNAGLYDPTTKTLDVQRWLKAEAYENQSHDHRHDADGHDPAHDVNRHGDSVRAFCLSYDQPLVWDRLVSWVEMLTTLYGERILRIKGLLSVTESELPIVIHGVQHVFHPPVQLDAWPGEERRSHLVFITRDLDPAMFESTLKSFNESEHNPL
ncbi:MAG: GTP-binding protein [Pseudomonadota bacterium]